MIISVLLSALKSTLYDFQQFLKKCSMSEFTKKYRFKDKTCREWPDALRVKRIKEQWVGDQVVWVDVWVKEWAGELSKSVSVWVSK